MLFRSSTQVGEVGSYAAHGIGAGDINGDGRVDILNVYGWWEQPAKATRQLAAGDVVRIETPGGGGFGAPKE